jgi:O-antigen/teichoic acid export membrane protein
VSAIPAEPLPYTMAERIAAVWSDSSVWLGRGFLAIVDQLLISGSNFLISVLLARWLVPEQYGAYALAFSLFLLISLAYQALLLEPMSVFGPSQHRRHRREYLGTLLRIHAVLGSATFIVLGLSAWVGREYEASSAFSGAMAGAAIAAPCILLFWLARRAFYLELAPVPAVAGSSFYCLLALSGLYAACRSGLLSPFTAFLLMAIGALATSGFLLIRLKPSFRLNTNVPSLSEVGGQHWIYGRWALAASLAAWASGDIFYFLVGGFAGMADSAALKALLNLTLPVGQAFGALSLLLLPYAARVQGEAGSASVKRLTWRITWLFGGGGIAYWTAVLLFRQPVLRFLYGGKYMGLAHLLPWVALASILWCTTYAPVIGLRAMQAPASVFFTYCASDVIAVAIGIPAVWFFGLAGAVFSITLLGVAALFAGFFLLGRTARSPQMLEKERRQQILKCSR